MSNTYAVRVQEKVIGLVIHPEMVQMSKDDPSLGEMVNRVKRMVKDFSGSAIILPSDVMSDGELAFQVVEVSEKE